MNKLFRIEDRVIDHLKLHGYRNILLFSGPGTGKTTVSKKICEIAQNDGYNCFFVEAGVTFGKDNVIEHINTLTMFDKTLTVFDEGIILSKEATFALRTITNNDQNHIFIINTNEIGKINDVLKDRFTCFDCSIPNDEETSAELWDWIEENRPDIYSQFSNDMMFQDYFQKNFTGSLRSFFQNCLAGTKINKQNDTMTQIYNMTPSEIQQQAFQTWLYHSGDYEQLKVFTNLCWKCDTVNFKIPFLVLILEWEKQFK